MPMTKAEKARLVDYVVTNGEFEGKKMFVKDEIRKLKEMGYTEDQVSGWTREVYQENG